MSKSKHKKLQTGNVGIPDDFLDKMSGLLGDEYTKFQSSLREKPINGLRVNTIKISPDDFLTISPFQLSPVPWCKDGFYINAENNDESNFPPGKHPYHYAGLYYLQEPSAMAAAEILSPQPGEKVLDIAAAPGGKTTHLANLMHNHGLLVANEIHSKRVWDLAENIERSGVKNTVVVNESPQRLAEHFVDFFDRILVDAPCSGEGMFRKSESARKEWSIDLPQHCAVRQISILDQAAQMLKTGGSLLYSTCTFSPEENEGVITSFLDTHLEFDIKESVLSSHLLPSRPEWVGLPKNNKIKRALRAWPHMLPAEGHFFALLVKNDSQGIHRQSQKELTRTARQGLSPKISKDQLNLWLEFAHENLNISFEHERLCVSGNYLYQGSEQKIGLYDLKVVHPGWWLGSFRKDRFIPSHSLALGLLAEQARNVIRLDVKDQITSIYLSGQSFSNVGEDGWVLICVEQFPLGWGKRTNNIIKNYYPRGLRIYSTF